jgi:ribonuclease D
MNYSASITKEEMSSLPVEHFPGQTVVVDNQGAVEQAISYLSTFDYVGFDTETRPSFSKKQHHKMALIQLATPEYCFLFRLNKLKGFPQQLTDFLKNGSTVKVGLSLVDDFHNMRKIMKFEPGNFIDLQKIAPSFGIKDASLQKIYAILFGKKISKRMQLTNWEADVLTEAQKQYAALDAWACLQIYQILNQPQ